MSTGPVYQPKQRVTPYIDPVNGNSDMTWQMTSGNFGG